MDIATWNVNSIRARKERVLPWLEAQSPAVVCLQETKVVDDAFPVAEVEAQGYSAAIHGQKTYNGVAILTREPVTDVVRGFADGEAEDDARLIAASVAGVRVISAYIPNGKEIGHDKYHYKLAWLERLRRYLDKHCDPSQPLALCGDFNVAPADLDVWDPELWRDRLLCSTAERAALQSILDWGVSDVFRHHHPDEPGFSWWDYRQLSFPKKKGIRIDFVLATAPLLERSTDARVDREARKGKQPSDHAPVIASFAE
jgi:exodeoxyribonuclease-3